jgi:Na+/melibiose symporter-like transporter
VVPLANIVWMMLALSYGITRERHASVRRQLDKRRAQPSAQLN